MKRLIKRYRMIQMSKIFQFFVILQSSGLSRGRLAPRERQNRAKDFEPQTKAVAALFPRPQMIAIVLESRVNLCRGALRIPQLPFPHFP